MTGSHSALSASRFVAGLLLTLPLMAAHAAEPAIPIPMPDSKREPVREKVQEPVRKPAPAPVAEESQLKLNPNSLDLLRNELGFEAARQRIQGYLWSADAKSRRLRVAVLDKGFRDWESRRGTSLPKRTRYIQGPIKAMNASPHGTLMAEIMTSMVVGAEWNKPDYANVPFDLYLINVAGFSNFKAAVQTIIDEKIDVVLYAEVWELGGNGDGRGFINAEVTKAIQSGALWINASGNFNGRAYDAAIEMGEKNLVTLPDEHNSLKMVCEPPKGESECLVKVTLTWNAFQDDSTKGTTKDLDLGVFDDKLKTVSVSRLKQVDIPGEAGAGESKYPRETVAVNLKKGDYYIRVRSLQQDWSEDDRLRILVDGDSVSIPSGSVNESLQNPADHKDVITVGGADAIRSSISMKLQKPELTVRSSAMEKFGKEFRGSSNAAAIVAAGVILVKYEDRSISREDFLERVSGDAAPLGEASWGWEGLNQMPPPGCLQAVEKKTGIRDIDRVLSEGGRWVETPLGPKILVNRDLSSLRPGLSVNAPQEALWVGDRGYQRRNRGVWDSDLSRSVEVIQRPQGTRLCNEDQSFRSFRLQ